MSKGTFLCKDDDGDIMLCTRERGQCKASVTNAHPPVYFCLGCKNLNYKLKHPQQMEGLTDDFNHPMN